MVNVAVFASGSGTNFENIVRSNIENCNIKLLIVDNKDAYAIKRSEALNIPCYVFIQKELGGKKPYEEAILEVLKANDIDMIILAGYMRFISDVLLNAYPNKIINIHPAYLPDCPGAHGIHDSFVSGKGFGGVTVHYVDNGVDTGPIIKQEKIMIEKDWDEAEFEKHVHELEYKLYPEVIRKLCQED